MQELNPLTQLLQAKYAELDAAKPDYISPSDLADATYKVLDPFKRSPELVKLAAILELRQLARGFCRQRRIVAEHAAEQTELFEDYLQERYPATREINGEKEEVYVLRKRLTATERRENACRLRSEGEAKIAHARALDAETDFLISIGELKEEEQPVQAPQE